MSIFKEDCKERTVGVNKADSRQQWKRIFGFNFGLWGEVVYRQGLSM